MKLAASIATASLCAAFARGAHAQEITPPADESAAFAEAPDPGAAAQFEAALAPFGEWFDDPRYGRVWSPAVGVVGVDFAPYVTGGRWSLSLYGLTWTSRDAWGQIPFHYGRWVALASRGWAWVPGTTWGPAWVSWRAGGAYVGWAPLPPAGGSLAAPERGASAWRFVPASQLGAAQPSYLGPAEVASIYPATAWSNAAQTMTVDERTVRYNPGPTGFAARAAMQVGALAETALPRPDVVARDPAATGATEAARLAGTMSYWAGRPAYAPPPPPGSVYAQPMTTPPGWYRWGGRRWGGAQASSVGTSGPWAASAPPGAPASGYSSGGGQSYFGGGGYGGASGGFVGASRGLWGGSRGR